MHVSTFLPMKKLDHARRHAHFSFKYFHSSIPGNPGRFSFFPHLGIFSRPRHRGACAPGPFPLDSFQMENFTPLQRRLPFSPVLSLCAAKLPFHSPLLRCGSRVLSASRCLNPLPLSFCLLPVPFLRSRDFLSFPTASAFGFVACRVERFLSSLPRRLSSLNFAARVVLLRLCRRLEELFGRQREILGLLNQLV